MKGNFKVRCVSRGLNRFYTVGKTYEFQDGFMINDMGEKFPYHKGIDNFKEWQNFSASAWELVTDTKEITIRQKGRKVIAVMTEDGKYIKSAKAKCSPADEFDFNIGAKLAFQRLTGEEITTGVEPYREVKRPAKVGEWIKVVDSDCHKFGTYFPGDIILVDKTCDYSEVADGVNRGTACRLLPDEYVVLENYQPKNSPKEKSLADYTIQELWEELDRRYNG